MLSFTIEVIPTVKIFYKTLIIYFIKESFKIDKEEVSLLLPSKFQEKFIRIYVKEAKNFQIALKAFEKYCMK